MDVPGPSVVSVTLPSGVMGAAPPTPATGRRPCACSCAENCETACCEKPLKRSGVAIGANCWPSSPTSGEPVATGATNETPADCPCGSCDFQSAPASCKYETARG